MDCTTADHIKRPLLFGHSRIQYMVPYYVYLFSDMNVEGVTKQSFNTLHVMFNGCQHMGVLTKYSLCLMLDFTLPVKSLRNKELCFPCNDSLLELIFVKDGI